MSRIFFVFRLVPVFRRFLPQFPHRSKPLLFCYSPPFTRQQCFLCCCVAVLLPSPAVVVVFLPLMTGGRIPEGVELVKPIPEAFAVNEFTPVNFTRPWWLQINTILSLSFKQCTLNVAALEQTRTVFLMHFINHFMFV